MNSFKSSIVAAAIAGFAAAPLCLCAAPGTAVGTAGGKSTTFTFPGLPVIPSGYLIQALPLPPGQVSPYIVAINDVGQVLGASYSSNFQSYYGVLWTAGQPPLTLPSLGGGKTTVAMGLNNSGVVVGYSYPTPGAYHSFIWTQTNGTSTLQIPGSAPSDHAVAINDAGLVVGHKDPQIYVWQSGSTSYLPMPPGYAVARMAAMNNVGNVVGDMITAYPALKHFPYIYLAGSPVRLQGLGSPYSINANNQAVGVLADSNGNMVGAAFWDADQNHTSKQLATPDGLVPWAFWANSINDNGVIVGGSDYEIPMYWPDSTSVGLDLNTLLTSDQAVSWTLTEAVAINRWGQIAGLGTFEGQQTAFIMTPLPQLAVDANRDGTIKLDGSDATSATNPYRFWVNDDDDETVDASEPLIYTEIEQDDKDILNESQQNWHADTISCERDLEDFNRLWISTPGIAAGLKNGDLKLAVNWMISEGTPAIKLFRAAEAEGGTDYLFKSGTATIQTQSFSGSGHYGVSVPVTPLRGGEDTTVIEGTNGFVLPTSLFSNLTEQNPKTCLLFEGCKSGLGQLRVVLLDKNGVEIGNEPCVWLQLMSANKMCHRWSCGDGDSTQPEDLRVDSRYAVLSPSASSLPDRERDLVLYVHGYNMKEYEKQRWIETTYKRLRILGYEGHVGGFTWPTAQQFINFSNSEIIAWPSGDRLKELLADLKSRGFRVHLFAHSLGNVVAGEALRRWRAEGNTTKLVDTYIASQGAVSAACYNPSAPLMPDYDKVPLTGSMRFPMPPDVYARYWRAGDDSQKPELWPASNPSYLSEAFMTTAATRWVNFYNRNDYALTGFYETGNRLKPAQLSNWLTGNLLSQYNYSSSTGFSEEHGIAGPFGFITLSIEPLKFPKDRYRIFTFAAPSWSLALGTIPTGGVFDSFTNLADETYGFGNEHRWHSGQFRSSNAERYQYWIALLDAARISHINP